MPLSDLPKEIHHEILSHLDIIVDQIAAAAAFPLWSSLLQTKYLQATRYYSDHSSNPGFPLIHMMIRYLGYFNLLFPRRTFDKTGHGARRQAALED